MSNPVESGHPCLGCAEPGFWDRGSFYKALAPAALPVANKKASAAERGALVYDSQCVYCHDTDPAKLATPPDDLPALLRAGKIRSHRFILEDADMQALVDYLKEVR